MADMLRPGGRAKLMVPPIGSHPRDPIVFRGAKLLVMFPRLASTDIVSTGARPSELSRVWVAIASSVVDS